MSSRRTLQERQNSVRSRIAQNVGKLERVDKGLQEIDVGGNQVMKESLETTHYFSAGSGEQPRDRPLGEMAFRRKTQKTGVAGATLSWISESKKDLDHPNSVRLTIEKGWRHLRRGTKAKRNLVPNLKSQ